jgi:hypothetical protein
VPAFPPCLEIKRRLDGSEQRFACELVALEPLLGVLRYVIDRHWSVAGVRLSPGCVTYAVYWTDRPYNVYWWVDARGRSLAFYFNVADSVVLGGDAFRWRDLCLDVLVQDDGSARVLDEAELPPDLPPPLTGYIRRARDAILAAPAALAAEARSVVEAAIRRSRRR